MNTALLVIAAVGGGIGGTVAAIYYGLRVYDWWREQGHVDLTVLSIGEAACVDRGRMMLYVHLRLHNPKATLCSITEAVLYQRTGIVLKPVGQQRSGEDWGYWYIGKMPIELAAKRHTEVELGSAVNKAALADTPWTKHWVRISLDDGSHIVSKPIDYAIDYGKAFG